eukprot:CAMPEP_0183467854 /NCGR_PEP_ID=MMETSP0370-20130417/151712_1 /TAXON_ID=268820 /ORGANISM="Peridinium aciculiferum, Strain PAER-2" /LENGTH=64 /DNA_ID=CAMNT_0025660215 /DNA_START=13 /DNA_END=204 /DNA_ORIENTATION=+
MPTVRFSDQDDVFVHLHRPFQLLQAPLGLENAIGDEKHKVAAGTYALAQGPRQVPLHVDVDVDE